MARVSYRSGEGHPYWKPEDDEFYIEFTFAAGWLERVWLEDACGVTDDWDPSLLIHARRAYWRAYFEHLTS